jgi:hypothetical protein
MDIRDRVMGDMPDSIFHKIAGIIPGYTGYVDRERRRDADKLLRTHIARQYSAQRDRLNRVQQAMARSGNLDNIAEVDRMVGVLQRFIDRLTTATYGYTGLFDPVKIEAADLDQLYAFDLALASGAEQVGAQIDALESDINSADPTQRAQLRTSMNTLATTLDDLNRRLDQRHDLLSTGRGVPQEEYNRLMSQLNQATAGAPPQYGAQPSQPQAGAQPQYGSAYTGSPTVSTGQYGTTGEQARYSGETPGGEPTRDLGRQTTGGEQARYGGETAAPERSRFEEGSAGGSAPGAGGSTIDMSGMGTSPSTPGISSMTEGNQGFAGMPSDETMGSDRTGVMPTGGEAGTGIETASSPAAAPGAPGEDIVEGLRAQNNLDIPDEGNSAQPDKTS